MFENDSVLICKLVLIVDFGSAKWVSLIQIKKGEFLQLGLNLLSYIKFSTVWSTVSTLPIRLVRNFVIGSTFNRQIYFLQDCLWWEVDRIMGHRMEGPGQSVNRSKSNNVDSKSGLRLVALLIWLTLSIWEKHVYLLLNYRRLNLTLILK